MDIEITPSNALRGECSLQGDKSIAHRSVILASLAEGESLISNYPLSEDPKMTIECLKTLGIKIKKTTPSSIKVQGSGLLGFSQPRHILFAANSGTTMRLLMGLLSFQRFSSWIDGDPSLRRRPMNRVKIPLQKMGAKIQLTKDKFPPCFITGTHLSGIEYSLAVPSAQVKSAILIAGLGANGNTVIYDPYLTRDHTERLLKTMGAKITVTNGRVALEGRNPLYGIEIKLPGDISSGAFLIGASVIVPESEVIIRDVGINPYRTGFIEILLKMGAKISIFNKRFTLFGEPIADIKAEFSQLKGIEISGEMIVKTIDELPLLAVLGTQAKGITLVKEASELRIKESDRIKAIVKTLKAMRANIEEREDGFVVKGPTRLQGTKLNPQKDHRILMSLIVAGLVADGKTIIQDKEIMDISFPDFMEKLELLREG
jgi:3-phosphoshikimate 1-carboxyvinyltransferase